MDKKLKEYVSLILKWNKIYNLTSIHTPEKIMTHHILDSLAIVPYIHGQRILDVGSGAGLPGIPLALSLPNKYFVLLDSNSKKIRFLSHVVMILKIKNVEIVHERVEKYHPQEKFDTIVTRAFSSLKNILQKTRHLYKIGGRLLAMKGKYPEQELQEISIPYLVHKLDVPNLNAERHLVEIMWLDSKWSDKDVMVIE